MHFTCVTDKVNVDIYLVINDRMTVDYVKVLMLVAVDVN